MESTFLGSVIFGSLWGTRERGPAAGEAVPECAIKLAPASGCWLLHSVRPPEELYVTLFSIFCRRPERGAFISGLSSPIDQRLTTGRLISPASFWISVYPETLTEKSVGGRRGVKRGLKQGTVRLHLCGAGQSHWKLVIPAEAERHRWGSEEFSGAWGTEGKRAGKEISACNIASHIIFLYVHNLSFFGPPFLKELPLQAFIICIFFEYVLSSD